MNHVSTTRLAAIAVAGHVIGRPHQSHNGIILTCPRCRQQYPCASDPVAFGFCAAGALVLEGFVEVCPRCYAEHHAGTTIKAEVRP